MSAADGQEPHARGAGLRDALSRPLHDLRISVTDRCNFRCPYCMPAEIYGEAYPFKQKDELLSFEEVERLARLFVAHGVEKIRITGGEPLLRHQLPQLIERIARIPGLRDLTLTTNGFLLAKQARDLQSAGLGRVTVSLDALDPAIFRRMSGREVDPARVLEGIEAAAAVGLAPIKLNCVVQRGVNEGELVGLAERFRGTGHILRFIEYMDVGTLNGWNLAEVVPADEILARIGERFPLEAVPPSYAGEVANRYRYRDGQGEIGVIASVTKPFCGGCSRARLTIEGKLVTCLFSDTGSDLRTPLRAGASDEELAAQIARVWKLRRDRYSEERAALTGASGAAPKRRRIEMYQVGG
jgi:cyclic pyranopterin phosphate synthase